MEKICISLSLHKDFCEKIPPPFNSHSVLLFSDGFIFLRWKVIQTNLTLQEKITPGWPKDGWVILGGNRTHNVHDNWDWVFSISEEQSKLWTLSRLLQNVLFFFFFLRRWEADLLYFCGLVCYASVFILKFVEVLNIFHCNKNSQTEEMCQGEILFHHSMYNTIKKKLGKFVEL